MRDGKASRNPGMALSRVGNLRCAAGKVSDRGPAESPGREGPVMDYPLVAVAEKLAAEFPRQPSTTVLRVVYRCVEEFPDDDRMFVEQAARAQLSSGKPVAR